jgi:group I intron endonuclease
MINFSLIILEYTSSENLISCEQKWIDLLKPEYNINPTAGSSKGYKHLEENLEKMRSAALGRKHTEEIRREMSESRRGINNSFFGKTHTDETKSIISAERRNRLVPPVPGILVEILDIETDITTTFNSIRSAADSIGSDIKTILRREKSQLAKGINTPIEVDI